MDSPPSQQSAGKLRLMCSYGGQIAPRPNSNTLMYLGGDTRIISFPRHLAASLSSFSSHLSATLRVSYPFTVKYQLPHLGLDSLISLTADDDLLIMLDELSRLPRSSPRLRLFLFPAKQLGLHKAYSPPETWFVDALKSTKIVGRKEAFLSGEGAESVVLETSSSFGSTSSSASLSNASAARVEDMEDGNRVKCSSADSILSNSSITSTISHPQAPIYQEPASHLPSMDSRAPAIPTEPEIVKPTPPLSKIPEPIQIPGYTFSPQPAIHQPQSQPMQFLPAGANYIPFLPPESFPISSYYPLHQPQQQYPVYFVPANSMHPYNMSMQYNLTTGGNLAPSRPPIHPNTAMLLPQVAYKEVTKIQPPVSEITSSEGIQQIPGLPQMNQPSQSLPIPAVEAVNFDDDPAYAQIYKSQPPAPPLPSQYQTMAEASTTFMLS